MSTATQPNAHPESKSMGAMLDLKSPFVGSNNEEDGIKCPCCGFEYVDFGSPDFISRGDYQNEWHGRGQLLVIPFQGECGGAWDLCFGFHKGNTMAFIRIRKDCRLGPGLMEACEQLVAYKGREHFDGYDIALAEVRRLARNERG
jgi:hypothetical protein